VNETNAVLTLGQMRSVPAMQIIEGSDFPQIIPNEPLNQVAADEPGSASDEKMPTIQATSS
jgi:hypothetical protein